MGSQDFLLDVLRSHGIEPSISTVLDIGTGNGKFSLELANMFKHVIMMIAGLDTLASDEMRSDKSSSTSTDSNLTGLGMATLFKGDRCSGRRKLDKYFF